MATAAPAAGSRVAWRRLGGLATGGGAVTAVGVAVLDFEPMHAEDILHVPKYPWSHDGLLSALDIARWD